MPTKKTQTQNRAPEKEDKNFGCRHFSCDSIRKAEGEDDRTYILSFSSETPYERWFGIEILDHGEGAVDLSRLNEIGVLLFNHDTYWVCGQILKAWVENNKGYAKVRFDTDEQAELIRQKVDSGTLKSTSVRYSVSVWEEVGAGKKSSNGKYSGPCSVAVKWMPLEVSVVSVPADATVGVGRSHEHEERKNKKECGRSINELQLLLNKTL